MKFRLFISLLLLTITAAKAQDVEGDWYTPHRASLINVRISKDSIIMQQCRYDFDGYYSSELEGEVRNREGSIYVVAIKKGEEEKFALLSFHNEEGKNMMNTASFNELYESQDEAEKNMGILQNETVEITLLNRSAIEKIAKQRDINTMTADDFKKFATKIIAIDTANAAFYAKKYKLAYLYGESIARIALSEIGINCLIKGNSFTSVMSKFGQDPETKDLFDELAQPK